MLNVLKIILRLTFFHVNYKLKCRADISTFFRKEQFGNIFVVVLCDYPDDGFRISRNI
jgi:hypothetical protein